MSGRWLQRNGPGSAAYALLLLLSSAGHAAWGVPTDTVVHQTPSIYETHSGPARMIEHLSFFVLANHSRDFYRGRFAFGVRYRPLTGSAIPTMTASRPRSMAVPRSSWPGP